MTFLGDLFRPLGGSASFKGPCSPSLKTYYLECNGPSRHKEDEMPTN